MATMIACGLLLVVGLVLTARWHAEPVVPAEEPPQDDAAGVARRALRAVILGAGAGLAAGVLVAGAGGRLIMRLLAATAGAEAQGRITEADRTVGEISVSGTFDFLTFAAIFLGLASGLLYLLVHRWLPDGRWRGPAYGLVLLSLFATRIEPLRDDNVDFDLVGPRWLALVTYILLVLVHGTAVAALAGRYSRALPLVGRSRRRWLPYLPALVLLGPVLVPFAVLAALLVGLAVLVTRAQGVAAALRAPRLQRAGRVLVGVLVVLGLPGTLLALAHIAT